MILLRYRDYYDYYDIPLTFSATDDNGNLYICFLAVEDVSKVDYISVQISEKTFSDLLENKVHLKSVFTTLEFGKKYIVSLMHENDALIAKETEMDFNEYLPIDSYFIGKKMVNY